MILIPAGSFAMGSPSDEPGRHSNEIQHQVTLSRPIYVSKYEVTQAEWVSVMGWNGSYFQGAYRPEEQVTWFDAVEYCNQRSAGEGIPPVYTISAITTNGIHITGATVTADWSKHGYRLLTEAEWEYACRAGSTTALSNGGITNPYSSPLDPNLDQVGWYDGNAELTSHQVGGKAANAWGLEGMPGNVWEWCWDCYGGYPAGPVVDPLGAATGSTRVERGGGWYDFAQDCRSAARRSDVPERLFDDIGLRVARTAE
jgi:formylglycine-generating enzyme required for sulfatase activity